MNTEHFNKHFNDNLEIGSDILDEYHAIQEASAGVEPDMASDEEIKQLMIEMWDELVPPIIEEDYTERDSFNDFISEQHEEFN